jgi:hypothetical protein
MSEGQSSNILSLHKQKIASPEDAGGLRLEETYQEYLILISYLSRNKVFAANEGSTFAKTFEGHRTVLHPTFGASKLWHSST